MENDNMKKEKSGISISGRQVNIGGDVIGGDKLINNYNPSFISDKFELIKELVESQSYNKDNLRITIDQIQNEVQKGKNADPTKVEKWLKFLASMSEDIFQVTVSTLINPVGGIAKAIQLIARKVKEEN